jgi:hypothetical protein
MAIVTNTFTSSDAKGLRESLSEKIYELHPMDFPITSMASKGKADGIHPEWQTDEIEAVDTGNKQLEGDEYTFSAITPTVRVGNYTQIMRKSFVVSGSEEKANKAGRKSEVAMQLAKASIALRRDQEAIVAENLAGIGGQTRQMATLGAWLKSNVDDATNGVDPDYVSGVPSGVGGVGPAGRTDGTQRAFTETILKAVMQSCFANGARPTHLVMGPWVMDVFAGFDGVATPTLNDNASASGTLAITSAVDLYKSNFGLLRARPNTYQRGRDAWFLDPQYLGIQMFRPFKTETPPKTGDAHKRVIIGELTLCVKQEKGLGLAADLSTS